MADIFLSYAEEDRAAARRVVGALEGQGWTVWWDRRIPTGKTWRAAIEDGIRDMRCMVVLWSPHSIGSEWVNEEAEEGRAAGVLMPVLIARVKPPLGLRGIQATDLIDWDGSPDASAMRQLIGDITTLMHSAGAGGGGATVTPTTTHDLVPEPVPSPPPKPHGMRHGWWVGLAGLGVALAVPLVIILRPQQAATVDPKPPQPPVAAPTPTARTPPAVALVPAPPPATVEKTTLKPLVTQKAASPAESHPPPIAKDTGKSKVNHARCEAILQRAQVGAALTEEDKAFLKREC